jgi:hypothetical protein
MRFENKNALKKKLCFVSWKVSLSHIASKLLIECYMLQRFDFFIFIKFNDFMTKFGDKYI